MHLTQFDIVTTMSKTKWWTSLFGRPIRGRNQQYYDFGFIFSGGHFVFMHVAVKQIKKTYKSVNFMFALDIDP